LRLRNQKRPPPIAPTTTTPTITHTQGSVLAADLVPPRLGEGHRGPADLAAVGIRDLARERDGERVLTIESGRRGGKVPLLGVEDVLAVLVLDEPIDLRDVDRLA